MPDKKALIYSYVKKIPKGKIVAYGDVAAMVDMSPRTVGFILSGMNENEMGDVPWHRVVNRQGFISSSKLGPKGILQQQMLEAEGLEIKDFQIINPAKFWFRFN